MFCSKFQYVLFSFRYVEENVRRSGMYRKYNKTLPDWLNDKPYKFTKHCLDRIASSKNIRKSDVVVEDKEKNNFRVRSVGQNNLYSVCLGDDSSLPTCTCDDWRRTLMPCKHMFAIINNVYGMSWKSFSAKYRSSPFLTLDSKVISEIGDDDVRMLSEDEDENNVPPAEVVPGLTLSQLQRKVYAKTSKAASCRELLNQIINMTYVIYDNDAYLYS